MCFPHFNYLIVRNLISTWIHVWITYDPSQALPTTWKPNVSFCQWACADRESFLWIFQAWNYKAQSLIFSPNSPNKITLNIPLELWVLPESQIINLAVNYLTATMPAWQTYPLWTPYIWVTATFMDTRRLVQLDKKDGISPVWWLSARSINLTWPNHRITNSIFLVLSAPIL